MPHQALILGLDQRLHRTAGPHGREPSILVREVVQLNHVDKIDAHALERAFQAGPRLGPFAVSGLGR